MQSEGFSNNGDYIGQINGPLNFSAGQSSAGFSVVILNDVVHEPNETFAVIVQKSASDPPNVDLTKATFTILNDD